MGEYTFFFSAHGTLSSIDHIIGHKTSVNKFKIKIILTIVSEHNGMKVEMNNWINFQKFNNI